MVREGGRVTVLVGMVTNEGRDLELRAACAVLGVRDVRVLGPVPEGAAVPGFRFIDRSSTDMAVLIDLVDEHVQDVAPDAVLMPPVTAYNQEHRLITAATLAALRPMAGTDRRVVPFVGCYEHGGDHWGVAAQVPPVFYVELSPADIDAKIAALHAHVSQVRTAPSERSARSVEALAQHRGLQAGVMWAEAFEVRRWVA